MQHVQHLVVASKNGYVAICPACISIREKFSISTVKVKGCFNLEKEKRTMSTNTDNRVVVTSEHENVHERIQRIQQL
jgi:hypothetical protein